MRAVLLSLIVLGTAAQGAEPAAKTAKPQQKVTPPVRKGLEEPSYLSPIVRQLLKQRMARHGVDMLALVQSVLFLDHQTTQRLAGEIAAEPRLTRPIADGLADVNAALPERFFVLQDELKSRAIDLADASRSSDHAQLAARLGELTQTCVSCHAAYLEPPPTLTP